MREAPTCAGPRARGVGQPLPNPRHSPSRTLPPAPGPWRRRRRRLTRQQPGSALSLRPLPRRPRAAADRRTLRRRLTQLPKRRPRVSPVPPHCACAATLPPPRSTVATDLLRLRQPFPSVPCGRTAGEGGSLARTSVVLTDAPAMFLHVEASGWVRGVEPGAGRGLG